ncbi:hypothetical protein [Heyndrickxia vini]|nr:hypothetical protein [Heyndrickxia vini]
MGEYTHLTIVPSEAELIVSSGQVGIDIEGYFPDSVEKQFQIAL